MIEYDLLDREEILDKGIRCCMEFLCVICPKCGDDTNITVTFPEHTAYHHDHGEYCIVHWTEEPGHKELRVPDAIRTKYNR